jgi:hypothetical protein
MVPMKIPFCRLWAILATRSPAQCNDDVALVLEGELLNITFSSGVC